jgi:integrase
MATIRKRGNAWHVQIRRKGFPSLTRSFPSKNDALLWVRHQEHALDLGDLPRNISTAKHITLGSLLERYSEQVSAKKRGAIPEQARIGAMLKHKLAKVSLAHLSPSVIAAYRDERLAMVSGDAVRRELGIIRHCLEVARNEWDAPLRANAVKLIALPPPGVARERRLQEGEAERLFQAIPERNTYLRPLLILALESAMRRGEILALQWADIDLTSRLLRIRHSKTGKPRTIALSPAALDALASCSNTTSKVFPVSPNAVRLAWERLCEKAGVVGLRFHDLRHEAISRMTELGLTQAEVALQSGHRDPRVLARYQHLNPQLLSSKLSKSLIGRT